MQQIYVLTARGGRVGDVVFVEVSRLARVVSNSQAFDHSVVELRG